MAAATSGDSLRFFIGGLGYCGSRLAVKLGQEFPGCQIAGCVRSETRKQSALLEGDDVSVHVLDLEDEYRGLDAAGELALSQATHLIQTIAPIADFDRDPLLALHSSILQESPTLRWVGYLSSTGVYGDHDGSWIDEDSELRCQDAKSLARVKAETEWRQFEEARCHKTRVDCFRCGGIYGPGRGPLFSSSLTSPPTAVKEASTANTPKYVNRILVDDICGAIIAAIKANAGLDTIQEGRVYNLVDDDPAPRSEVMKEARRLVGATEQEEQSAVALQGRRRPTSRNTGNKRCRNQRLKDDYKWEPIAPTYREGLAILHRDC